MSTRTTPFLTAPPPPCRASGSTSPSAASATAASPSTTRSSSSTPRTCPSSCSPPSSATSTSSRRCSTSAFPTSSSCASSAGGRSSSASPRPHALSLCAVHHRVLRVTPVADDMRGTSPLVRHLAQSRHQTGVMDTTYTTPAHGHTAKRECSLPLIVSSIEVASGCEGRACEGRHTRRWRHLFRPPRASRSARSKHAILVCSNARCRPLRR